MIKSEMKLKQIEECKRKGIIDAVFFLDSFNDRTVSCYVVKIVWNGKISLACYMSQDGKSFPTPEIIQWVAQKTRFKYVYQVPTGGDDNDWLFTSVRLKKSKAVFYITDEEYDKDEVYKVSKQILIKLFGG